MSHTAVKAGATFPKIVVKSPAGSNVELGKIGESADWKMVVVYRGLHCPLCTKYLNKLETLKERFAENGVEVIAVSADSADQLAEHLSQLDISFPICYGLNIEQMQQLGVYISNPRSPEETDHPFAEPGTFVINAKNQIQLVDISNGPFARPDLEALASGLEFIKAPDNNYPIRGTF